MKVVLCGSSSCCPAVEVLSDKVLIGEDANTCTLTKEQWQILRGKVLSGEL